MKYFLFEFIISPCGHIPPVSSEQIVYDQGPEVLWTPEGPEICSVFTKILLLRLCSGQPQLPSQCGYHTNEVQSHKCKYKPASDKPCPYFILKNEILDEIVDKQETFIERIQSWELFNYYPIPNYKWAEHCG